MTNAIAIALASTVAYFAVSSVSSSFATLLNMF
jgi:hypothetical protein